MERRLPEIRQAPADLLEHIRLLFGMIREESKYIVRLLPWFTPHDSTLHLDHLFVVADQLLGAQRYSTLAASELVVLASALYAHDWGMAVSGREESCLRAQGACDQVSLLADEPQRFADFAATAPSSMSAEQIWIDYVRATHGRRSGLRLRNTLSSLSPTFAEAVARVAEGHVLPDRQIRDLDRYPHTFGIFGQTVNLAALAEYVRLVDLLDIGENRTPYALWTFVNPPDLLSATEWNKHRALSPVAIEHTDTLRRAHVTGTTSDSGVFAALHDLRAWIDRDFQATIAHLRSLGQPYDLDLDSRIQWTVHPNGFEPLLVRFSFDRSAALGLLSRELYGGDPHVFARELLQNSIDALDARSALLAAQGLLFEPKIQIHLDAKPDRLVVRWIDNGIGMDRDTVETFLSQVGRSWYRSNQFQRQFGVVDPLSQFGVGLLSCFSVASSLLITTRREALEPSQGNTGLRILIPSRESYFRIEVASTAPVGTSLGFEIPLSDSSPSAGSLFEYIRNIARYVSPHIEVSVDGHRTHLPSMSGATTWADDEHDPALRLDGDPESCAELLRHCDLLTFYFGSKQGTYEGHFSGLYPKNPRRVSMPHLEVTFGSAQVRLREIATNGGSQVFVKGIKLAEPREGSSQILAVEGHGLWPKPSLALNILRPSMVEFGLSRATATLKDNQLANRAWGEIAARVRDSVLVEKAAPRDRALALGIARTCFAIPAEALHEIVPDVMFPVPVVRAAKGAMWVSLEELVADGDICEAPNELSAALSVDRVPSPFRPSNWVARALREWEGPDAALSAVGTSYGPDDPFLRGAVPLWQRVLRRLGYVADTFVQTASGAGDGLPLFCRVWRRRPALAKIEYQSRVLEKLRAAEDRDIVVPSLMNWILRNSHGSPVYVSPPALVTFPPELGNIAGIGGYFWNKDHPKIMPLVLTLGRLAARVARGAVPARTRALFQHYTDSAYIGYAGWSRRVTQRRAITVYERLLELCPREEVSGVAALDTTDYLAGTVGEHYEYASWYDLKNWRRSDSHPGVLLTG